MNHMQSLPTFSVPSQYPQNFIGGQFLKKHEEWKAQLEYLLAKGYSIPDYIQRIVQTGVIDLFDSSVYNPKKALTFNRKTYSQLSELQAKYTCPQDNYNTWLSIDSGFRASYLAEMVQKSIITPLKPHEIPRATYNPLGSVTQGPKCRITFHHLINSQYNKLRISLEHQLRNNNILLNFKEGQVIDLKSYYHQLPLNYQSSLSCSFWAMYHGRATAFRFLVLLLVVEFF